MCGWETAAYAAAVMAAAYGANQQAEAANEAADRQAQALNAALLQQDEWSKKAEQTAMDNAEQYNTEKQVPMRYGVTLCASTNTGNARLMMAARR